MISTVQVFDFFKTKTYIQKADHHHGIPAFIEKTNFSALKCLTPLVILAAISVSPNSWAAVIAVDAINVDIASGDGCSLREALINANTDSDTSSECVAGNGADVITLPSGTYSFPAPTVSESSLAQFSDPAINDLDLFDDVTITGAGVGATVLDGGGVSGIFHVARGGIGVTIEDLTITGSGTPNLNNGEAPLLINYTGAQSTVQLNRVEITNSQGSGANSSSNGRGVIDVTTNVALSIVDSSISNNLGQPFALLNWDGSFTLDSSTVNGNERAAEIRNNRLGSDTEVTIVNSTFSGNVGNDSGTSALNVFGSSNNRPMAMKLFNNTFSDNDTGAPNGTAIRLFGENFGTGAVFEIENTIIANSQESLGGSDCVVTNDPDVFVDPGSNLVEDGSCIDTNTGSLAVDPMLAVLADNGGETLTHELLVGSLAVDVGNSTVCASALVGAADQRNLIRPNSAGCDIGSYEQNIQPIALDNTATVNFQTSDTILVLFNDTDPDGQVDPTTVEIVSQSANGTVTINPVNGVLTYTHTGSNTGQDVFTYLVRDNAAEASNVATVTVDINEFPVTTDDDDDVTRGGDVVIPILDNDSDPDGNLDLTTLSILSQPSQGQLTIDPATGNITYTHGGNGAFTTDSFTYAIADDDGAVSNTSTVTIDIAIPFIVSPADGSILTGTSQTFTWNADGGDVDDWILTIGSIFNGNDLFDSGLLPGTQLSEIVNNLPFNGTTIHLRLRHRQTGGGFINLRLTLTSLTAPSCGGLRATIVGTPGDDVLLGTPGDDVIFGGDGNDTLNGGAGNDTYCGEDGDDRIFDIGGGNDIAFGGNGADEIVLGAGDDNIFAGPGNDLLNGGSGNDLIFGQLGNDQIFGQSGNDSLMGNDGDDFILGFDGVDVINGGAGNDIVNGGPGNDSVDGGAGNDTVFGLTGNDFVEGGPGNDQVFGQLGEDTVRGGDGDDSIFGNQGDDTISTTSGTNIINGGPGNDNITGGSGDDQIFGDGDVLQIGNDVINGGAGQDLIVSFAGNDTINSDDGEADTVNGGPGVNSCTTDALDTVFNCQ